jgi:YesN/AraC family two-component response regulator
MGAIFKEYFNTSPQNYLINFRINKACNLMKNPNLSIGEISRSVGYDDPFLFSKMFKKIKGIPPRIYRKNNMIIE